MTSERATAYGGVIATIEELGAVKLQPAETGRWTEERAQRLFGDLTECGPVARVA